MTARRRRSPEREPPGIRPGFYASWRGEMYRVLAPGDGHDPLRLPLEHLDTQEQIAPTLSALFASASGALVAPTLDALHAAVAAVRAASHPATSMGLAAQEQRADAIIAAVAAVDTMVADEERRALLQGERFARTAAVERAVRRLDPPISRATYYAHRTLLARHGGSRARLAVALQRSTRGRTRASAAQLHLVDTLTLRYCVRAHAPMRPAALYRLIRDTLHRTGDRWIDPTRCADVPPALVDDLLNERLPMAYIAENPDNARLLVPVAPPSRWWVYAHLRTLAATPDGGRALVTARQGPDAWERAFLVFDSFVHKAAFPLHYVFADHYKLDVFTVDDATRQIRTRLWLSVLIDAYSRCVLGTALLDEEPCIESIQGALLDAVWPTPAEAGDDAPVGRGIYGIPQMLVLDNAWAHHAHSLESLAREISRGGQYTAIELVHRPPYRARWGAIVERLFGNLSRKIGDHLVGAIRSRERAHVRGALDDACLLYGDVDEFIRETIARYHTTLHSELGMTPHERWLQGLQGTGPPLVPPRTAEVERLFWRMDPKPRVITSRGVCAFGLHYWSSELHRALRRGPDGRAIRYALRYQPADISRVALFRAGTWVGDVWAREFRQPDGSWPTISQAEWDMAKGLASARATATDSREALATANKWRTRGHERLAERRRLERHRSRTQGSTTLRGSAATETEACARADERDEQEWTALALAFSQPFAGHRGGGGS